MKNAICLAVILACVTLAMATSSSELSGRVYYSDGTPAEGVVLSIGNYDVTSGQDGSYRITFLRPGWQVVTIRPPNKGAKSFNVWVNPQPTTKDFPIDW